MTQHLEHRAMDGAVIPLDEAGEMILIDPAYRELVSGGGDPTPPPPTSPPASPPPASPPPVSPPPPPVCWPPFPPADNGGDKSGDAGSDNGSDNDLA